MPDLNLRLPQNVPGNFYISSECIDCDMCRVTAPNVFKRNDDLSMSVVFHQPESETERHMANEALNDCPVDAIGNDGGAA